MDVRQQIKDIGDVTLDSEKQIAEAETAFDELSELQQKFIRNRRTLVSARQQIDELFIIDIIEKIESLEEPTIQNENQWNDLLKKYNDLSDEDKALITNIDVLTSGLETLSAIKVAHAISLIDNIGEVKTGQLANVKDGLENAESAYRSLNDEEKALVTNYEILTNSRSEYDRIGREARDVVQNALNEMYIKGWAYIVKDSSSHWSGSATFHITGELRNDSGQDISRANIRYNVYDNNEKLIGSAIDSISNWKQGVIWKYDATCFVGRSEASRGVKYDSRPTELNAYK